MAAETMRETTRDSKEVVSYTQDGHVVTLTIRRPEARNAINGDVAEQLEAALDRYEADGETSAYCRSWCTMAAAEGGWPRESGRDDHDGRSNHRK